MVVHRLRAQSGDQLVESLCSKSFERRIGCSSPAHTVDNLRPGEILLNHFLNRVDVVLQISVNADQRIAIRCEQAGDKRILVAAVSRKLDAKELLGILRQFAYDWPGPVRASIVNEPNRAIAGDLPGRDEAA